MRRGLSLLEVVLALAILGVSLAVVGELIRLGARAGQRARDDMESQLICESIINEIASGAQLPEMVVDAPVDQLGEWLCSVETQAVDDAGLLAVRVTVRRTAKIDSAAPPYSLTRWIIDPSVELAAREAEAAMKEQLEQRKNAQASGTQASDTASSGDSNQSGESGQPNQSGQGDRGGGGRQRPSLPDGIRPPNGGQPPDGLQLPPGFDPSQIQQFIPGGRGGRGGRGGPGGPGGPRGR